MTIRLYATRAEYDQYQESNWSDTGELDSLTFNRLNLRAARLLENVTYATIYDTDTDGFPTDMDVSVAFTEFVCEQIHYWFIEGDSLVNDFDGGSLGGLNLPASSARGKLRVSPDAMQRLHGVVDLGNPSY